MDWDNFWRWLTGGGGGVGSGGGGGMSGGR